MPKIIVPQAMVPRDLSTAAGSIDLCQASPDGDQGCPPCAWVNVVVRPINNGNPIAPGPVTPDAKGNFLHPVFNFAAPHADVGKRRAPQLNSPLSSLVASQPQSANRAEIRVETDPGCYWIGTPCSISFIGGTPGDVYDYSVSFSSIKTREKNCANVDLMEPAFVFALTSFFYLEGGSFQNVPASFLPEYHTHFEVVQGAAKIVLVSGLVPLDASYGPSGRIPLNLASFPAGLQISTGIYRTTGAL